MDKHVELIKKLKALADRGVDGEAKNAQKLLDKMLKKHNLTVEDIEGEKQQDYFFKATGINASLFAQIVKRVNYDLKIYFFPAAKVKQFGLAGNHMITCTAAEFIEIEQMFDVYKRLYKKESEIFYKAFLAANDLLAIPPKSEQKTTSDLSPEEFEEWKRTQAIASKIKTETIRKQLSNGTLPTACS